ncbi:MAG: TIGR01777 family oxidoreductase [Planctomycetia bacterium]|jgi:uncharacterized protein (TIGR01777 family)
MVPPTLPKRVAVTGASGLIGSAVCAYLVEHGCEVIRMVRDPEQANPEQGRVYWSIEEETIDIESLEGIDAVVHLAGRNVAKGRWTDEIKEEIRESRLKGTALWGKMLPKMKQPPKVFVAASAVGYYGDTGYLAADESIGPGKHFLSRLTRDWENEVEHFEVPGLRKVLMRFGVVLSKRGGALAEMNKLFRYGLGGPLGSGNQMISWVSLTDAVRAVAHVLSDESMSGPVNVTSPGSLTNREFVRSLARVLHRPTLLWVPGFMLFLILGEMGNELLLVHSHVVPKRLTESGFTFMHPELEPFLREELK